MAKKTRSDAANLLRAHFAAELDEERRALQGRKIVAGGCGAKTPPSPQVSLRGTGRGLRTELATAALILILATLPLVTAAPSQASLSMTRALQNGQAQAFGRRIGQALGDALASYRKLPRPADDIPLNNRFR